MDWNGNLRLPFVSQPADTSYSFLYSYNYDHFPEMKQPSMQAMTHQGMLPTLTETAMSNLGQDPKKRRLSNEQLELLENSFQEEIKLDPDRKMKLAKELGLQPRQIAVWFQNRRARWKGKQLERLYDALKQEYDAVSRDKQKLQQEVMVLRATLKDQVAKKKASTGFTDISGEETVVSIQNPKMMAANKLDQIAECSYPMMDMDDYNNDTA